MAALNSSYFQILAMSRKDPHTSKRNYPEIGKFRNVEFIQADILKTETYPKLDDVDCVVHSVGAITDMFDYKKILRNPTEILQNPLGLF